MNKIKKKQQEYNRIDKIQFQAEIEKAKKAGASDDELQEIASDMFHKMNVIEEEIKVLISQEWIQKAERSFLPIPDSQDEQYWEVGNITHIYYLKPSGISYVRNLIREEMSSRRKAILEWAAPAIGIIGAITGLVAVILR